MLAHPEQQLADKAEVLQRLSAVLGSDGLITDPAECDYYAQDVYSKGPEPLAVVRPAGKQELAQAVRLATGAGLPVIPRGGGMSYTAGYVAPKPGAVIVDLGRMNRVLDINPIDMTATVEAGCTWENLQTALEPHRLRALAWGTLSGLKATIGGGMSQNGIFWGARDGVIVDAAISFEVVLADGSIIKTGPDFYRPFGPDLTGLFGADTGAFGVKATITMQLVREATAFAYGSYTFETAEGFFSAMSGIAREGLASESFGFDPYLQSQRMKRDSLAKDAKSLVKLMKAQDSAWKAIKEGARVVAAGRSFLDAGSFSLHIICEGRNEAAVNADLKAAEEIVAGAGGRVVENTIPKIARANPFPPVNSMVGPAGERWVPVHGFLPHSRLIEGWNRIQQLFADHAAKMERLGVTAGALLAGVSRSCCLIEPVFYWPDSLEELHRRSLEPDHLAKLTRFPPNEEARLLVHDLRKKLISIFRELGAAHLQIARTYPLKDALGREASNLLGAVKRAVDPDGLMNPGSLGL